MSGLRINLKRLIKEVKEMILMGILWTLCLMILFFAVVGLESWSRGFIW